MGCRRGGGLGGSSCQSAAAAMDQFPASGFETGRGLGWGGSSEGYLRAMTDLQPAVCGRPQNNCSCGEELAFVYFGPRK